MSKYKFTHFLSDPQTYAAAQQYWDELFDSLFSGHEDHAQWHTWFDTRFADGTPRRDGNPIWSMVAPAGRKGIRIIQDEPGAFAPEITAWMDTFGDDNDGTCIEELVISCILSHETEQIVRQLLQAFIVQNLSKDEMEKLIEALLPPVARSL